ncbi:MAG TPA: hypothetical protein PK951_12420 [Chitinophagaceae bacterium]|uniref:hypothetical protein n=1 Tax=Nitrosomonas europaea TaxID=915 RepID=UPI0000191D96|nr:hypothetical protein [Nitrosomonas europaea]SDX01179.1 hypothetical protein SAMN05216310_1822 [Nitrosomonas europaea]SET53276.1 hypothetical protein SAMN05216309_1812 [Nitrosomonas europaea]SKA09657.1 hypothetical protein SAMN02745113_02689 [Nitrosomonas europaea]HRO71185.1 hypothetical protein [Chitinophagaceae bacterium]
MKILRQQPEDRNKIYSLHEPQVYCMAKGKDMTGVYRGKCEVNGNPYHAARSNLNYYRTTS